VAFPRQVTIVASEATRESLRTLGMSRVKDQLANTPKEMASLEQRWRVSATRRRRRGCATGWRSRRLLSLRCRRWSSLYPISPSIGR